MFKLLKYLKKYKKDCITAPLYKMLEAGFELLVPLMISNIIDVGIKNGDKNYIYIMCFLIFLSGAIGFGCTLFAQYYAARAAVGFATDLKSKLFKKIQSLPYSKIDSIGSSTLITRMTSDVNQVQTGVNIALRLLLRSPFIVFGAMIMSMVIDFKMTMIFLIVILALFIIIFTITIVSIPLYKKVQSLLDTLLSKCRESLIGIRVIRAFCIEKSQYNKFTDQNEKYTKLQIKVGRISALLNPLTFAVINIGIIFLIKSGSLKVYEGILTQGAIVALYNYMSQILVELIKFANMIIVINKTLASGNRINEIIELNDSVKKSENEKSESYIEFKNVSFKYNKSSEMILENISFKVRKGEKIGIIGGTGSGKTSLINLLLRFYDTTDGKIYISNNNIDSYDIKDLRDKIGLVPQKSVLFKGTIRENLLFSNENASDEDIDIAIKISQSENIINSKINGIDEQVEQGGKNFSGGQKQRLAIARALIKKPEILIFDNSFSALDNITDLNLRKGLDSLPYDPTIFIVSQRTASVQNCDKILVLDDGKLVGNGTHNELMENCEIYREIYESQFVAVSD